MDLKNTAALFQVNILIDETNLNLVVGKETNKFNLPLVTSEMKTVVSVSGLS